MLNKNLIGIITNYLGYQKGINFKIQLYENNLNKVNWKSLSKNTSIPYQFFEKHLALQSKEMNIKIDWTELSGNTNIPVTFFEKHLDKVDWYSLSRNTNIPYWFFEKYIYDLEYESKLDWYNLSSNTGIPYIFFLPGGRETVKIILIYVKKKDYLIK